MLLCGHKSACFVPSWVCVFIKSYPCLSFAGACSSFKQYPEHASSYFTTFYSYTTADNMQAPAQRLVKLSSLLLYLPLGIELIWEVFVICIGLHFCSIVLQSEYAK